MMTRPKIQRLDKLMVRLPNGLRDVLKTRAAISHRSMNSEVVYHLERALKGETAATGGVFGDATPAAASNDPALQGGSTNTNA